MDTLAHRERANGFSDDFRNYIMNYLVEIKHYEISLALITTMEMYRSYFADCNSNIINLWQDYIKNDDVRDSVLSLINQEFCFDIAYFEGGKIIAPRKI